MSVIIRKHLYLPVRVWPWLKALISASQAPETCDQVQVDPDLAEQEEKKHGRSERAMMQAEVGVLPDHAAARQRVPALT